MTMSIKESFIYTAYGSITLQMSFEWNSPGRTKREEEPKKKKKEKEKEPPPHNWVSGWAPISKKTCSQNLNILYIVSYLESIESHILYIKKRLTKQ